MYLCLHMEWWRCALVGVCIQSIIYMLTCIHSWHVQKGTCFKGADTILVLSILHDCKIIGLFQSSSILPFTKISMGMTVWFEASRISSLECETLLTMFLPIYNVACLGMAIGQFSEFRILSDKSSDVTETGHICSSHIEVKKICLMQSFYLFSSPFIFCERSHLALTDSISNKKTRQQQMLLLLYRFVHEILYQ